ncbi:hypothetical protein HYT26_01020 [Candidatus Pacearchaeota archaeon]|nr:hypothetical protein [Candidatus Pacearchaeota archaeon]
MKEGKKEFKIRNIKDFWKWLWNSDSIWSWVVFFILAFILIRVVFFSLASFATGSTLPFVVIESCSMNHPGFLGEFEGWWRDYGAWYNERNITKDQFQGFKYNTGMKMGDIIVVSKRSEIKLGDVIIFQTNKEAVSKRPIIHRAISLNPLATKGDYNSKQLNVCRRAPESMVLSANYKNCRL